MYKYASFVSQTWQYLGHTKLVLGSTARLSIYQGLSGEVYYTVGVTFSASERVGKYLAGFTPSAKKKGHILSVIRPERKLSRH